MFSIRSCHVGGPIRRHCRKIKTGFHRNAGLVVFLNGTVCFLLPIFFAAFPDTLHSNAAVQTVASGIWKKSRSPDVIDADTVCKIEYCLSGLYVVAIQAEGKMATRTVVVLNQ
jgi:hypothetical protein